MGNIYLICKKNEFGTYLKVGKLYEILHILELPRYTYVRVMDETHTLNYYEIMDFYTLEETREIKINELIKEV